MERPLSELLKKLWLSRADTAEDGFVSFCPESAPLLQELRHASARVQNLVIVRLDAIGDNFLFLDCLRRLRALFSRAKIGVVTYSENKSVYDRCRDVDWTFYIEREPFQIYPKYREGCFKKLAEAKECQGALLNPLYSREIHSEEIMRRIPARDRIGIAGDFSNIEARMAERMGASYSALIPVDNSLVRHELHRNLEITSLLGSPERKIELRAPLTEADRALAAQMVADFSLGEFGVVFPGLRGGAVSPKFWGADNFAALVDRLTVQHGRKVVLLGGPGEDKIESEITAACSSNLSIFSDLGIWQAAALLERAAFFIGSDTSMAHISAALRVPTFVLLGGGHFGRFFPYPGTDHVVCISRELPCFGCHWKCTEAYNKCLADISVDDVVRVFEAQGSAKDLPGPQARAARPSRPVRAKIDLILPGGMQTWHLKEAWTAALEQAGALNRVFRPTPATAGHLLDYLRSGGDADMLLALGGDHHLGFLHDTEEKRDAWRRYRGARVCNSFESTRDSPYRRYVPRVRSALGAFTHFVYTDEVDGPIFERANIPSLWWPQAADQRLFSSRVEPEDRRPRVFFCGKVWDEYLLRKSLLQALRGNDLCEFVESATAGEMTQHYNRNLFAINLPGVLGGFNVRTYEALSCGSVLLQFQPEGRPRNNALFRHGRHLVYYGYSSLGPLMDTIREMEKDPGAFVPVAKAGREEFLAHHTIERRIDQLLDWVSTGKTPTYPQYGEIAPEALERARRQRFVNDRYLFEGRPLWNPEAMNDFSALGFVNHRGFLRPLCQEAELMAHGGRIVESMRLFKAAIERDSEPEHAHNDLGVLRWQRGERELALSHFRAALRENAAYRPAVINYGELLSDGGQTEQARDVYRHYLKTAGSDAGVEMLLNQET